MLFPTLASLAALAPLMANAQVTATGTNGPTNPPEPTFYPIGSTVNQTSDSRLVSLNNVSSGKRATNTTRPRRDVDSVSLIPGQ